MHSFRLQNCSWLSLQFMLKTTVFERFSYSLDTLCPCCTLICAYCDRGQRRFSSFGDWSPSLTAALEFVCKCFLSPGHHSKFSLTHAQQVCFTHAQYKEGHGLHHVVAFDFVVKTTSTIGSTISLLFGSFQLSY